MNTSTFIKIEANRTAIIDMATFLRNNPTKQWIFDLIDQPFQLAICYVRLGLNTDPEVAALNIGCSSHTAKQIQQALTR